MSVKKKILFISKHVVHDNIAMGGHNLFNYNLKRFCEDINFEVGFVVVHKQDEDFRKMKLQFGSNAIDFSIKIPVFFRLFTYLYYNTFSRIIFSFIKADYYYLDIIYGFFYTKALKNIKKANWIPDVISFEWTEVLFLYDQVEKLFRNSTKIATEQDLSFIKLTRQYGDNILYKFFLKNFKDRELSILKRLQMVTVVSIDDKKYLGDIGFNKDNVFLLFPFYQRRNVPQKEIGDIIYFYGAMSRVVNQEAVDWFIEKVFVPYQLFNTHAFVIVGAGVPKQFSDKYKSISNISFTGFVNDPSILFENALCMVVPLLNGGGIKIKVLEAMSCSVTVLTNDIGIEGINAIPDVSYLQCITPESYHSNILKLSSNKYIAKQIGEQGRALIENNFDFQKSFLKYRDRILDYTNKKAL